MEHDFNELRRELAFAGTHLDNAIRDANRRDRFDVAVSLRKMRALLDLACLEFNDAIHRNNKYPADDGEEVSTHGCVDGESDS